MSTLYPMAQSLSKEDITALYFELSSKLLRYLELDQRINFPKPDSKLYTERENALLMMFWQDVKIINNDLLALDEEIARRSKMIGVK